MSNYSSPNEIQIGTGEAVLAGDLFVPAVVQGMVLFAHGSGSSRQSPRNRYVAQILHQGGMATLLMDLLTEEEEQIDLRTSQYRFDIDRLAGRLVGAIDWLVNQRSTEWFDIGLFGASTGAAAALIAAAERPEVIKAVVSRGGRPDLAGPSLPLVKAPTLLIVGSADVPVIGLNQRAKAEMQTSTELRLIPGASHLFEEPGALEQVAHLALEWFDKHFD